MPESGPEELDNAESGSRQEPDVETEPAAEKFDNLRAELTDVAFEVYLEKIDTDTPLSENTVKAIYSNSAILSEKPTRSETAAVDREIIWPLIKECGGLQIPTGEIPINPDEAADTPTGDVVNMLHEYRRDLGIETKTETKTNEGAEPQDSIENIRRRYEDKIDTVNNLPEEDLSNNFANRLGEAEKNLLAAYYLTKRELRVADINQEASNYSEGVIEEKEQELNQSAEGTLADKVTGLLNELYHVANNEADYDTILSIMPDDMKEFREEVETAQGKLEAIPQAAENARNLKEAASHNFVQGPDKNYWHIGAIEDQDGTVKIYPAGEEDSGFRYVSLVEEGGETFTEKYEAVTDDEVIEELVYQPQQDDQTENNEGEGEGVEDQEKAKKLTQSEIKKTLKNELDAGRDKEGVYREIWEQAKDRGAIETVDGGMYRREQETLGGKTKPKWFRISPSGSKEQYGQAETRASLKEEGEVEMAYHNFFQKVMSEYEDQLHKEERQEARANRPTDTAGEVPENVKGQERGIDTADVPLEDIINGRGDYIDKDDIAEIIKQASRAGNEPEDIVDGLLHSLESGTVDEVFYNSNLDLTYEGGVWKRVYSDDRDEKTEATFNDPASFRQTLEKAVGKSSHFVPAEERESDTTEDEKEIGPEDSNIIEDSEEVPIDTDNLPYERSDMEEDLRKEKAREEILQSVQDRGIFMDLEGNCFVQSRANESSPSWVQFDSFKAYEDYRDENKGEPEEVNISWEQIKKSVTRDLEEVSEEMTSEKGLDIESEDIKTKVESGYLGKDKIANIVEQSDSLDEAINEILDHPAFQLENGLNAIKQPKTNDEGDPMWVTVVSEDDSPVDSYSNQEMYDQLEDRLSQVFAEHEDDSRSEKIPEISVDNTVRWNAPEGGSGSPREVESIMNTSSGQYVKLSGDDRLYPIDQIEPMDTEKTQSPEDIDDYLDKEDIRNIIRDSTSVFASAEEILSHEAFFWDENRFVTRQDNGLWEMVQGGDQPNRTFFDTEMSSRTLRMIAEHEEFNPADQAETSEQIVDHANAFAESVIASLNKLIDASPGDESMTDEKEIRLSFEKLQGFIASERELTSELLQKYRDRFVQTINYYRSHKQDIWRQSDLSLGEVKEALSQIDNALENLEQ